MRGSIVVLDLLQNKLVGQKFVVERRFAISLRWTARWTGIGTDM
jgi:hypothetical protein